MTAAFAAPTHPKEAKRQGKALRESCPRGAHSALPQTERDPVAIVEQGNVGRLEDLVPLRIGRMAANPYAFLRGAAAVMAHDLRDTPTSGLATQICGDAHIGNVGFYASAERRLTLGLNDFDESVRGPWEFDLKRLCTSVVVAGRTGGVSEDCARQAAQDAARAYRDTMRTLAGLPVLQAWTSSLEDVLHGLDVEDLEKVLDRVTSKAQGNTSTRAAKRWVTQVESSDWRFVEEPPVLTQVVGEQERAVERALHDYVGSLPEERRELVTRFSIADVAFRVVGVGSVGTRSYIVLLHGNGEDPLVLQVKEARCSVFAEQLSQRCGHEGQRIVHAQRVMQSSSDPLLGWTHFDGRDFQVRTWRDMKGGIDAELLDEDELDDYARLCGALLARAHARGFDPRPVAGYLGKSEETDVAMRDFAVAYADRTEADHAALVAAVDSGRLEAAVIEA